MSEIQSFISALRLKLGWRSSIIPPKALAPKNMGSKPKRPVLERGKDMAAKAMKCTILSLTLGACGGASKGQSMDTVRMVVTVRVRGMSRYRRIRQGYWSFILKASDVFSSVMCNILKRCLISRVCGF